LNFPKAMMNLPSLADLAASGAALFNQQARLIRLRFAEANGISPEALLPQRIKGGYNGLPDRVLHTTRIEKILLDDLK
jgi:hypothetical protein